MLHDGSDGIIFLKDFLKSGVLLDFGCFFFAWMEVVLG